MMNLRPPLKYLACSPIEPQTKTISLVFDHWMGIHPIEWQKNAQSIPIDITFPSFSVNLIKGSLKV